MSAAVCLLIFIFNLGWFDLTEREQTPTSYIEMLMFINWFNKATRSSQELAVAERWSFDLIMLHLI